MRFFIAIAFFPAWSSCSSPAPVQNTGDLGTPDWVLPIDPRPQSVANQVSSALLGQYDLSGALFHYDQVPGLSAKMTAAGMRDWRVGVGRWEVSTRLLPSLTDGTDCTGPEAALPALAWAPTGSADPTLIQPRDWFTDDGSPVTIAMTNDDQRYQLGYLRAVLDVATAFGAEPYVDIDHMPLSLSQSRTFQRTDCSDSWSNQVSNVRPADSDVFAAAVTGLVQRVVQGSDGVPGRPVRYFEFWNEPELPYAWDPAFEAAPGQLNQFFTAAIKVLFSLDAYRKQAAQPLRLGLGSFALAQTAAAALGAFDQDPIAGAYVPLDFISFHSYHNNPLDIVADIASVAAARQQTSHYQDAELVLSEWGPDLANPPDPHTLAAALHACTVIALGAAVGLDRSHHSLFYDFYDGILLGLIGNGGQPLPLYYAYTLLSQLIGAGGARVPPQGAENGSLDGGLGAVLVVKDQTDGALRALLVNRGAASRVARFDVGGMPAIPRQVTTFADAGGAPQVGAATGPLLTVPGGGLLLAEF